MFVCRGIRPALRFDERSPRPAALSRPPRRHDRRAASRLHVARQTPGTVESPPTPADSKAATGRPTTAGQQFPPYFLSYSVRDTSFVSIRAQYGALAESSAGRTRLADVQVRVGDPQARQHPRHASRLGRQQPRNCRSATTAKPSRARFGSPPTPATATRSTTICASRPRPRSAPKKKTHRPTSASKPRKRTSAPSLRPSSSTAPHGSSG